MTRIRDCGRRAVAEGGVRVRATGSGDSRRAGFAGLATCGSVWSCPVCSERILSGRQEEIRDAVSAWHDRGGSVVMQTLTMRHKRGQSLDDLWSALSYAWDKVTSGRSWARLQRAYGTPIPRTVKAGPRRGQVVTEPRIGFARVVETTYGRNGWHVHAHVGLFLPAGLSADQLDDIRGTMFAAWAAALERRGMLAPEERYSAMSSAPSSTDAALGDYLTKSVYEVDASKLALELARGDLKNARAGNRSPFRILSDFLAWGVAEDLAVWAEWEKASAGRRQLTWSAGLRDFLLAGSPERTDEEIAAEEIGTAADDLVEIPAEGLRMIARHVLHAAILDAAEADDTGSVLRRYLVLRGIPFRDVGAFVG